jgi:hypothetical protein
LPRTRPPPGVGRLRLAYERQFGPRQLTEDERGWRLSRESTAPSVTTRSYLEGLRREPSVAKSGDKQEGKDAKGGESEGERTLSPTARRQLKQRQERQKLIKQQVDEGTLTIRQMTPEEREKYPPRPPKKKN